MWIARVATVFILSAALIAPAGACRLEGGFTGATAQVRPAAEAVELVLPDGRIVKLAGVHVPDGVRADAQAAMPGLLAGAMRIVPVRAAPDRYARSVAQVMSSGTWLQGTLVARGLAVASTMPGETECLSELLAAERAARARRLGLWANPGEFVAQSRDLATLQAKRGRYLAVEGVIISVGVRDYATFLNLGARWTEDFAVIVVKADRDRIERAIGPLPALRGRGIRVRGVLATSGPPRIRIAEGAALELMD